MLALKRPGRAPSWISGPHAVTCHASFPALWLPGSLSPPCAQLCAAAVTPGKSAGGFLWCLTLLEMCFLDRDLRAVIWTHQGLGIRSQSRPLSCIIHPTCVGDCHLQ